MREWKFWDWLGFATVFIGALILAAETALSTSPEIKKVLPDFFLSQLWGYAPLIFITIGGIILVIRHRWANRQELPKDKSASNNKNNLDLFLDIAKASASLQAAEKPISDSEKLRQLSNSRKKIVYFTDLMKIENSLQIEALLKPYINTVVNFQAYIQPDNIFRQEDDSFTVGAITADKAFIICKFDKRHENYLARSSSSELTSLSGAIYGRSGNVLMIDLCNPASASPPIFR